MRYYFCLICISSLLISACKNKSHDTLFTLKSSKTTGITFNNQIIETDSANILTEEYIFNGGGVAIGDFNNDGTPDVFFTGNQVPNKLYLNLGGFKFKDVSSVAGIEAKDRWNTGATVVDINTDGLLDIYVCAARETDLSKRANLLFVNQGMDSNGVPRFKELAKQYKIDESGNSMGAAFFDYDKDGLLDLYVLNNEQVHVLPTNYRKKVVDGSAVSNDQLYHNNGDGTFSNMTIEAGITIEGFGLGVAISDLNYDGWPDIYVTNDYLTNDLLYTNNGDGTFSNNIENHTKHQSKFAMGSDIADYNNDGYLDIITLDMLGETNYRMKTTFMGKNYINYVLNERWGYQYQHMRNMLQLGNGHDIPFSEVGLLAGIPKTDWSWSPLFVDADNDGYRDLLITNGFPRDITDMDFSDFRLSVSQYLSPEKILDSIPVIKIPNYAYRNKADLTFEDVGASWGLNIPSFSNGAAFGDLDNDGDMDYVVNNINDEAFVFENTSRNGDKAPNYLKVALKGSQQNPMGIGTKMVVRLGDGDFQYYEHQLTRGYMSSVEPGAHFGLGNSNGVSSLEVVWPDGKFQKIDSIRPNITKVIDYKDAKPISPEQLSFPLVPKKLDSLFTEISFAANIDFTHIERDIVDYSAQALLPHKLSQNGPCMAVGDINGDDFEDFIVGSAAGFSPVLFLQNSDGRFDRKPLFDTVEDKKFEEESMVLFDLENDGDLDLYLVSGSNEFPAESAQYADRLLTNDGKGNFTRAIDKMPQIKASGSVVKAQDFDQDGFVDLFVGGRTPFGKYPYPEKSFLLRNKSGVLENVTSTYCDALSEVGMITDAAWADVDQDGLSDLIVVGEFMPITIFKNHKTSFTKFEAHGLEDYLGWWESIVAADLDKDGDQDFVVGNLGANNFYEPSKERPVTVLAKDFDKNGSVDPIIFSYAKNTNGDFESYPINFWGDLSKQSPMFRSKFDFYKDFALTTQESLFDSTELKDVTTLIGNYDRSVYIENLGDGTFKLSELPIEAQFAPINGITVLDFDNDGKLDLLLVGNDFGNEVFVGRYDAFNGLVLQGNGDGTFEPIKSDQSGFLVPGDAKSITMIRSSDDSESYLVTQNQGKLLLFKNNTIPKP